MTARTAIVLLQALTFPALAWLLFVAGQWKLALAQILLGGTTVLVYA